MPVFEGLHQQAGQKTAPDQSQRIKFLLHCPLIDSVIDLSQQAFLT
jgi:hypothetical protein